MANEISKAILTFEGQKAKVVFCDNEWKPYNGNTKAYKKNVRSIRSTIRSDGVVEHTLPVWSVDDYLRLNGVDTLKPLTMEQFRNDEAPLRVTNEKPIVWYEYDAGNRTYRTFHLGRNKEYLERWMNYDCPTLVRCSTNQKELFITPFGFPLSVFTLTLVENSCFAEQFIDKTITDEEIDAILDVAGDSAIGQAAMDIRKARGTDPEQVQRALERVKKTEQKIQRLINSKEVAREIKDAQLQFVKDFGDGKLDCGWLEWYAVSEMPLSYDMRLVVGAGKRTSRQLHIQFPVVRQSVNAQSCGAEVAKQIIKEKLGLDLYYVKTLD